MRRLARELAIDPATLSNWFHRGDSSARIAAAVSARADELTSVDEQRATNIEKWNAMVKEIEELRRS
jgi:hypothetical protein